MGPVKVRVAAPEPAPRPTTSGVWIAILVVVGTSVGMLSLAYTRADSESIVRNTTGGPLLERPSTRRDGEPARDEAPAARFEPEADGEALIAARPSPAPGPAGSLEEASQRVPIELYSASWCSACATAHRWLDANNVRYEEIDVDHRPGARAQLVALNPRRTLPTFDIDGDVLVGFDPARLGSAITTAAARHDD
jgi:glutaredoxin